MLGREGPQAGVGKGVTGAKMATWPPLRPPVWPRVSQFSFLLLRGPTCEIRNGSQIDSELENPDVSQLGVPPDPPLTLAPAKLL